MPYCKRLESANLDTPEGLEAEDIEELEMEDDDE